MHYKIYLDVVFILNLIMDYTVLSVWAKAMKHTTTYLRLLLTAMIGAAWSVACIMIDIPHILEIIGTYLVVPACMIIVICRRRFFMNLITFLITSMFISGACQFFLRNNLKVYKMIFLSVIFIQGGELTYKTIAKYVKRRRLIYTVRVLFNGHTIKAKGLYDTGNSLCDPYNGKMVCVAERSIFKAYIDSTNTEKLMERFIPYKSVGNENGLIKVITMDKMIIAKEDGNLIIDKPEIALFDGKLSASKEYEIILNQGLLA